LFFQEELKKRLNARIQYAKFLQDTVGEMAKELKTSKRSDLRRTADDLDGFMQKVSHGLSTSHLQHGLWFLACLSANSRYQRR
jgi:LETM1 and EF-hand domain-containing protein 1